MDVTIEQIVAKGRFTKRDVRFEVYRIRVDGMDSGNVAFHEGAPICMSETFSPIDLEEIEKQVAELKKQRQVTASNPPDVPEHLRKQESKESEVYDELDA